MQMGMLKTHDEDDDGTARRIKVQVCIFMMKEWLMNHVQERVSKITGRCSGWRSMYSSG
jgi:hypothetical protein